MTNGSDTKRRAEELLLLRLNDQLGPEEAAELDALLAEDPSLAGDEAFLAALKSEIAARETGASPGELGLARLKRAVEAEAREPAEIAAPDQAGGKVVAFPRSAGRTWRYAAIAATVLLAVQTVTIFSNPDAVLRLAGGSVERHQGPVFVVAFVPEATEAEIRDLLVGLGMTIIDGPSALGLYQIAAAEDADAAAALAALTQAPVVESAERK